MRQGIANFLIRRFYGEPLFILDSLICVVSWHINTVPLAIYSSCQEAESFKKLSILVRSLFSNYNIIMTQTDCGVLIFMFLILCFTRILNRLETEEFFPYENGTILRGLLSLCVMFNHISTIYGDGVLLPHLYNSGSIAVGIFFFLSAYGLMKQHCNRKDYHKGFISKRLSRVLVPYLFITFIYWLYYFVIGETYSLIEVINAALSGDPIVSYSWYIIEIMIIYLCFYLSMIIFRKNYHGVVIFNGLCVLAMCLIFKMAAFRSAWYESTYMFVIGLVFTLYEKKLIVFLKRWLIPITIISALAAFSLYGNNKLFVIRELAFLIVIICIFSSWKIRNPLLSFCGSISMELYMVHGLAIKCIRRFITSEKDLVGMILVISVALLLAFMLNQLFRKKKS